MDLREGLGGPRVHLHVHASGQVLRTGTSMYRDTDMRFWLVQAEAERKGGTSCEPPTREAGSWTTAGPQALFLQAGFPFNQRHVQSATARTSGAARPQLGQPGIIMATGAFHHSRTSPQPYCLFRAGARGTSL